MAAVNAICYVADQGFLVPTLASAVRIRHFVKPDVAEIFVFTIGVDDDMLARARDALGSHAVKIVPMPDEFFKDLDRDRLSKTYTPLGTFGRFFMERLLPDSIQNIVYLDGDVWPAQDPSALILTPVPAGRFAAADDTLSLRARMGVGHTAKVASAYMASLGLRPQTGYFNAGVFAVSRETWREVARDAYQFYKTKPELCKHFDQSALNAIVGDRRLPLSVKWNFQTQLKVWNADRSIEPVLVHYNRTPKPWQARLEPWPKMFEAYALAFAPLASIGATPRLLSDEEAERANAEFRKMYAYLQAPLVSRAALLVMGFGKSERAAWL
ncbi:MAG: hypothetical protein JWN07_2506 [Hyphomicrobiales bacterium]|nr:hypothetical protein [Hyphomicrobiales bacterium]